MVTMIMMMTRCTTNIAGIMTMIRFTTMIMIINTTMIMIITTTMMMMGLLGGGR